jgi:hypothetical protein
VNRQEIAETLALEALSWILGGELLDGFLNASGTERDQLARLAGDPVFLAGVLDFLLEEDARVIGFCDATGRPYLAVGEARAALPGGQLPHWT